MNNTRTAQTVLVATLLLPSVPGPGQQVVERRVAIIVPEADDERVVHTRDAVAFWNQTLSDLESGVRLREVALIIPDGRAVENFAREVSLRGGRLPRGAAGPEQARPFHFMYFLAGARPGRDRLGTFYLFYFISGSGELCNSDQIPSF